MKRRYSIRLEYEIEVKDHTEIPVHRAEWPENTPPEYIIERLKCIRELLAKLVEKPEELEAYMKYRALTMLESEVFDVKEIGAKNGIRLDGDNILSSVIDELGEATKAHFVEARMKEGEYEGLMPFMEAFREKRIDVSFSDLS